MTPTIITSATASLLFRRTLTYLMGQRFKIPFVLLSFLFLTAASSLPPREGEEPKSAPSAEALQMIQERMASLSGSLSGMSTPPRIEGKINLPAVMPKVSKKENQGETKS